MEFKKIQYIERKTKKIKIEKVPGEKALKFLYYNPFGELLLNTIIKRKLLTEIYGRLMNKPSSVSKIKPFIEELNINIDEAEKHIDEFTSFNDFFYRKLKKNTREIDLKEENFVSPADGKILVFENIKETDKFYIKGKSFNLIKFLNDEELAKKYVDGTFVIIRLAPVDYHRIHFPTDGIIGQSKLINGYYYSVSTHAIRKNFDIFLENKRELSLLKTDNFGDILMIEIAATMVGGITQVYKANTKVNKGEEKSYFSFGGSSIVLLFEKNKIKFDNDLIENTKNNIETKVYMGEKIANEI